MQIELAINSQSELRHAVEGRDTFSAYCHLMVEVSGLTKVEFKHFDLEDKGPVFANATSLVIFIQRLLQGHRSILSIHDDPRASGVLAGDVFEIRDLDNNSMIDGLSREDLWKLVGELNDFFEHTLRPLHRELCDYLIQGSFIRNPDASPIF